MSRYFELAEKIYEALLAKGAGIGNASIPIIIKVLEENEAVEHSGTILWVFVALLLCAVTGVMLMVVR